VCILPFDEPEHFHGEGGSPVSNHAGTNTGANTEENVKEMLDKKDYDQARRILLELLERKPDDPELNFFCGSVHDTLGLERDAVRFYEKALKNRIKGVLREKALIQLGSSYRSIGLYEMAKRTLMQGLKEFPENGAMKAFLAMTLYNLNENRAAVSLLLDALLSSAGDKWINEYRRALKFYSENLDETW
jgi:tetratricopeptide (TPR) repeat protein